MWCVESAEQDFIDFILPFISWNIAYTSSVNMKNGILILSAQISLTMLLVFTETLHLCPPISRIKLKAVEPLNTPMLKRYLCNFTQRILSCKTSEIKDKQRFQPCDLEKCRWNYKTWLTKHEGSKITSSNQVLFKFIHSNALKWMKI